MLERKLQILVVEDDDVDRMIIKRALKDSKINHELFFVVDHESGKEATFSKEYDCIFLDYNLPGGSGLELLKFIRESKNMSPIIIVTSQGDEKIAVEAMKLGADDYIPKNLLSGDGIGQTVRYMVNKKKQTERQAQLENQLKETQKQLQVVVDNAPIIIFSLDNNATFRLFEGKSLNKIGVNLKKVLNVSLREIDGVPVTIDDYERAIKGEEFSKIIKWKESYFEIQYSPILNEKKEITGVLGIASDITRHIEAEEELKHAKQLAEETVKMKEQFLANISHEIRTPMNGIIGLTRILLSSKVNQEQLKYLQSISLCGDSLMIIINDLLDVSKIEAGKMSFEKITFNIVELANQTIELYQAKADEKSIQLCLELDNKIPKYIEGDPTRLSQILNNLVSNAIKFTEKGEVRLSMLQTNNDGNKTTITFNVKDSGIGIPEKSLSSIFDSFTQACSDTTRKFGGTGLGLTIVKNLIELQEGAISVKSKLGAGTIFTFSLTYSISSEIKSKKISNESDQLDISHLRILVAEDNAINQLVVKKTFADWNTTIDIAENGIMAVEMLKSNDYDLILMDIQMPEMDGYTATEIIRKKLPMNKRSTPIMAMTAHASAVEKQKCRESGMQDYISKPFDPANLKKKIAELCGNLVTEVAVAMASDKTIPPALDLQEQDTTTISEKQTKATQNKNQDTSCNINLNYLKQLSGGNEKFFIELIETFLDMTPKALDKMSQSLVQKEWDELKGIAHRIKPSYGYVGLKDIQVLLTKIEKWDIQKVKTEVIQELLEEIKSTTENAFIQLREALQTGN